MVGQRQKKGEAGEAVKYLTRNSALKKLQLRPAEFRRLCILKGIYPQEPKSRLRAQKGNSQIKILYLKKDIDFLAHDPLIGKVRDYNTYVKKLKTAQAKKDKEREKIIESTKPVMRLEHLVLERYPTFKTALRDIDDPLTMCFLLSRLGQGNENTHTLVSMSRKLTVEFMHYVIAARCLRRVFISVKGYYYQAEIMGQTITWIVPHPLALVKPPGINLKIMKIFVEFYIVLLGFVNFRLYQALNLHYPPRLQNMTRKEKRLEKMDLVQSLNRDLITKTVEEDTAEDEAMEDVYKFMEDNEKLKAAKKERDMERKQKSLFTGLKFFINRENNLESLTFVIRACGGQVSWDATQGSGSLYSEDDPKITHHIVDRPEMDQKHLSRFYIQPQWVYDSINARVLLPVQDYFPGVTLPAHVSPFEAADAEYMPPEKEKLLELLKQRKADRAAKRQKKAQKNKGTDDSKKTEDAKGDNNNSASKKGETKKAQQEKDDLHEFMDEESDDELKDFSNYEVVKNVKELADDFIDEDEDDDAVEKNYKPPEDNNSDEDAESEEEEPVVKTKAMAKMAVKKGKTFVEKSSEKTEEIENKRLAEMQIKRKHKRMYKALKRKELKAERKVTHMKKKREKLDKKDKREEMKEKKNLIAKERKNTAKK